MKYYVIFLFAVLGVYTVHVHDARLTELSDLEQKQYTFIDPSHQIINREPAQTETDEAAASSPRDIVAPYAVKASKSDDMYVGAFIAEQKEPGEVDLNEISKIRKYLNKLADEYEKMPADVKVLYPSAIPIKSYTKSQAEARDIYETEFYLMMVKFREKEDIEAKQILQLAQRNDVQGKVDNLRYIKSQIEQNLEKRKSSFKTQRMLAEINLMFLNLPYETVMNYFENKMTAEDLKLCQEGLSELSAEAKKMWESNKTSIQGLEHARALTHAETFFETNHRFTSETFTFFVAVGAVTFNSMWIKSHGDPLAMERHILSLKDPIAHVSFYAFMQANGFYTNFHKGRQKFAMMSAANRSRMLTRLSYEGMAVGSLASSIVSDLGHSITQCVDKWFEGKKDEASLQSCNEAWKEWTVRKKMTQYFPQIITMWAAQRGTELIERGAIKAFKRVSASDWAKATGETLKSLTTRHVTKEAVLELGTKISAADVVLTFTPGAGWISKGARLVGKLGAVTRIALFITVDQIVTAYLNRPLNNVVIPFMSYYDFKDFNALWLQADQGNWDSAKIVQLNHQHADRFEEEIHNYTQNMQQWRNHLNEAFDMDLAGWMEMTKKLLHQEDYAYQFYDEFASNLSENYSTRQGVSDGTKDKAELNYITGYPFRTLPFYGVKPKEYKDKGVNMNDLYLTKPQVLERAQKKYVLEVAKKYKDKKYIFQDVDENKMYQDIIINLNSGDNLTMARGILLLKDLYATYELGIKEASFAATSQVLGNMGNGSMVLTGWVAQKKAEYDMTKYSKEFTNFFSSLRSELGTPYPIIYPFAGFSQAVAASSKFKSSGEMADYSKWSINKLYSFNKISDLMMFNMMCGGLNAQVKKMKLGVAWMTPEFVPPSILNISDRRNSFCGTVTTSTNMYSSAVDGKNLQKYFIENLDSSIIKDYADESFDKWWEVRAKAPLKAEFKDYDKKYKELTKEAFSSFRGTASTYNAVKDVGNHFKFYYPASLQKSLKAETNVYLQLINRALYQDYQLTNGEKEKSEKTQKTIALKKEFNDNLQKVKEEKRTDVLGIKKLWNWVWDNSIDTTKRVVNIYHNSTEDSKDYVRKATTQITDKGFNSIYYPMKTENDILVLNQLMTDYYKFIGTQENRFDDYIAHAKKVDTAISEILVRAGFLVKGDKKQEDILMEDLFSASGNENSTTTYISADIGKKTELVTYKDKVVHFSSQLIALVSSTASRQEDIDLYLEKFNKAVSNLDWQLGNEKNRIQLHQLSRQFVESIKSLSAVPLKSRNLLETKQKTQNIVVRFGKMMSAFESELEKNEKKATDLSSRSRVILAAVQGLRQVESEIKRYIRMGMLLSNSLELDNLESKTEMAK